MGCAAEPEQLQYKASGAVIADNMPIVIMSHRWVIEGKMGEFTETFIEAQ